MANRSFFLRATRKIDENKKTYKEKVEETKKHAARLVDMQQYVDNSEEKRGLLLKLLKESKSSDSDETLLEKGVLVYIKFLDTIDTISKDLTKAGIEHATITGKTNQKARGKIAEEFKGNPNSKVILISNCAGESLNLNGTNELILYDLPDGPGKFNQIIGRIVRSFSKFEAQGRSFYLHYCIVEDTLDEYKPILLSSKKELEEEILHADTISLKGQGSFDGMMLKEIRKEMLWKVKGRKKK